MPRASQSCPWVDLRFISPNDKEYLNSLAQDLEKKELGYFPHMRYRGKPGLMNPRNFVKCIREWDPEDMELIETRVFPDLRKAAQEVMNTIDGKVCVGDRVPIIRLARLDPDLENGFPFTLCNVVFMPTKPKHVPNPLSITWLRKTILHEVSHVLQRHFVKNFDLFYQANGFRRIPKLCVEKARAVATEDGFEPISNPDTWKAYAYGLPLDADRRVILFTNLAVDGPNYRELAFYWYPGTGIVECMGWLSEISPKLLQDITIPKSSKQALYTMHRVSELEGHPHEVFARVWENLI